MSSPSWFITQLYYSSGVTALPYIVGYGQGRLAVQEPDKHGWDNHGRDGYYQPDNQIQVRNVPLSPPVMPVTKVIYSLYIA